MFKQLKLIIIPNIFEP